MAESLPDLDELLAGIQDLIAAHEEEREDDPGEGNFNCEACNACYNCRFCVGCDSCEDCTYCNDCVDCVAVTQSNRCVSCQKSSYLEDCRGCEGSRYLALCVDCKDCVHCLACVGLEGAEYHVLNEKVTKKEFYKILNRMREDLDARVEHGWRPEVIGLVSVDPAEDEDDEEEFEHDEEAEAFLRRPTREQPAADDRSPASRREDPEPEEDGDFEHERTPVRFDAPRRPPPDSDSGLWDDSPRRSRRSSSSLSRGRRPPPSDRPSDSLWEDEASGRRDERSRSANKRERSDASVRTGSATGNTSVRIGRRPSKAREVTSAGAKAPWRDAAEDAPVARKKEGKVDPFGDDSLDLGEVAPSRPEPQAQAKEPPRNEPPAAKGRGGGLKRGRRPPRKPS